MNIKEEGEDNQFKNSLKNRINLKIKNKENSNKTKNKKIKYIKDFD